MLFGAYVAVCSEINATHTNTMWAERTVVVCKPVVVSRDQ
jgi:hypothetical protein